jgi:alcohol dehydrogenase class IV
MPSSLLELRKFVAPEFVFGAGASRLAGQYGQNLRVRKVLLVEGPHISELGWAESMRQSLLDAGLELAVFTDVTPNPRDHEVMAGAEVYRSQNCDAIVALGGGSPMDCAKAVGAVCSNNRHVLEFEGVDKVERPGPPLICIPTTAGTAAEVSQFSIITDTARKVKIAIVSKAMVPDAALIDPACTSTMDAELTAYTGLDALTHAVEAYVSNASSPVTDMHALEAIRLIRDNLVAAIEQPDNLEVRAGMLLASTHAGLAFSNAILGAVHAMAHSLGGFLDLPHGQCNAILLDKVMEANFEAAPERFRDIGRALGAAIPEQASRTEQREMVLRTVQDLKRRAGVTDCLADLGVRREDLHALAEKAINDPCMITNPQELCCEDVENIYDAAC